MSYTIGASEQKYPSLMKLNKNCLLVRHLPCLCIHVCSRETWHIVHSVWWSFLLWHLFSAAFNQVCHIWTVLTVISVVYVCMCWFLLSMLSSANITHLIWCVVYVLHIYLYTYFVLCSETFFSHVCQWTEIWSSVSNKETLNLTERLNKRGELDH